MNEYLKRNTLEQLRWQETLQALESARQGKVVDADLVNAWFKCWGSSDELPTDVTLENLMHKIYTRETMERGLADSEAGRTKDIHAIRSRFGLPE